MICSIKGLCKPWRPALPGHVIFYDLNFMCAILSVCSNKVLSPLLMLSKGRPANKRPQGLLHMQLIVLYYSLQTKFIKSILFLIDRSERSGKVDARKHTLQVQGQQEVLHS